MAGLLLGYAVTTLTWWAVVFTGHASAPAFAAAWVLSWLVTAACASRVDAPLYRLAPWTPRASAALAAVLLLVPLLMWQPYSRLGSADDQGNRRYRAYFTADFMWHTALTEALARQEPRPGNPLMAGERLHYYWGYFRVPATIAANTGVGVEQALKINAVMTALLLTASIYLAAWASVPQRPWAGAAGVALTILAASLEGWAGIADTVRRGLPFAELRNLNVDAIAAWAFKGLRVDNLPRTMWYTPQHGFSCALGLLAVPAALADGLHVRWPGRLLIGCALGASVAFNPLLGAACCTVYAATVLMSGRTGALAPAATRHRLKPVLYALVAAHIIVVLPVGLALWWCWLNEVGDGAAGVLRLGFVGLARNATIPSFVLQFGPLLPPIALAIWRGAQDRRTLRPSLVGMAIAVAVMHLVALSVDPAWAGFRGGNLFFAFAPAAVTAGLLRVEDRVSRRAAAGLVFAVFIAGAPTTAIDTFNAQDVDNLDLSRQAERVRGADIAFDPSQEFHWTVIVTPAQQEALGWIRHNTPEGAVVQAEPIGRGRETWSLIPSLAARPTASTTPVPLLQLPIYDERNRQVKAIYADTDSGRAWQAARALGIQFLYADRIERTAYPDGVRKFEQDPLHFAVVFRNADAAVYAVRP